jgi:hypothetical protein
VRPVATAIGSIIGGIDGKDGVCRIDIKCWSGRLRPGAYDQGETTQKDNNQGDTGKTEDKSFIHFIPSLVYFGPRRADSAFAGFGVAPAGPIGPAIYTVLFILKKGVAMKRPMCHQTTLVPLAGISVLSNGRIA